MILRALKGYYDRKAVGSNDEIAPEGWERKEIPFIAVINDSGDLVGIEDTREGEGKKKKAKSYFVPVGVKKTSGIAANLLWDTANYVFGIGERGTEQKAAFADRIRNEIPDTPIKTALLSFLSADQSERLKTFDSWREIAEGKPNIAIRLDGDSRLVFQNDQIKATIDRQAQAKEIDGVCLVTGERDRISILHTAIKGVWGAQTSGGNIVSFNQDSFSSYGLRGEQGKNAPIGESTMFAYTTALNTLLKSKQFLQIGDAKNGISTVFWATEETLFEEAFGSIFAEPSKDNPDENTKFIKALFESPQTGGFIENDSAKKFYLLGLSPNAARISVRIWKAGTVGEFAKNIRTHFRDLEIIKSEKEPFYYSLWRLLVNAAIQDKSENIPPNIAGDFMRSIIDGTPYPSSLLGLVLRRVKSDGGNVKPVRAALIKACLNRHMRINKKPTDKEITVALDKDQPSIGYQLGRLFAALEKIQEEASPGINATIRDRYYGAACSSPASVFPTLLRLKNHHIAKIDVGRGVNLEKLLGEIVERLDDFPAHLKLLEQGKFAIGYYHQRQDFFKPNTSKEK
ncbi:MAG: type I-C CRISPR-associated protein Cas8c/Csd1 [Helicobacteraceae bacterium]|jgi:CRISPR-associated protein Csd1|nr:type I-C CRISPR-associated protein Cas8c/Csd1 [Helicobacteraceae bacterium]